MFKNSPLEKEVIARLEGDPRIPDPAEIAVASDGATVILRGTVERFSQRRAAEQDARAVTDVGEVINHLKVNLLPSDRREDDEIRSAALHAVRWDTDAPADSVDIQLRDGWVTLRGEVRHQFESDAAYDDVSRLYGVTGVTNEITVTGPPVARRSPGGL